MGDASPMVKFSPGVPAFWSKAAPSSALTRELFSTRKTIADASKRQASLGWFIFHELFSVAQIFNFSWLPIQRDKDYSIVQIGLAEGGREKNEIFRIERFD